MTAPASSTVTAPASSTLSASEIGEQVEDLQPEVTQQSDIGRGPRVTMENVEVMKARVSTTVTNMLASQSLRALPTCMLYS